MWLFIHFLLAPILSSMSTLLLNMDHSDLAFNNKLSYSDYNKKYTSEEWNALHKFRPMVMEALTQDYMKTDTYLIRWLRACDLNLRDANNMLREALAWRKENNMDNILNEPTFDLFKGAPCILEGTDKEGNPIAIVQIIGHDVRKMVLAGQREKMVHYMNQFLEKTEAKIRELANATGKDITQAVTLVDARGYNLKQHACMDCMRMYVEFLRNFEKFFPELNRYVVIINAPMIAQPFIEIVKPVLSKNSQRAVKIFGVKKDEWQTFLLNIIAPDQLPIQFGGTKQIKLETKYSRLLASAPQVGGETT